MRYICAWCDSIMRTDDQPGLDSHGICAPCMDAELAKLEELKQAAGRLELLNEVVGSFRVEVALPCVHHGRKQS